MATTSNSPPYFRKERVTKVPFFAKKLREKKNKKKKDRKQETRKRRKKDEKNRREFLTFFSLPSLSLSISSLPSLFLCPRIFWFFERIFSQWVWLTSWSGPALWSPCNVPTPTLPKPGSTRFDYLWFLSNHIYIYQFNHDLMKLPFLVQTDARKYCLVNFISP